MVKFVHTADWQLGMTRWFLDDDAQPRFDADRVQAIRTIGQVARDHDAQFVVVAGDVFEHNQLGPRVVGRAIEALREIDVPVFLLPGNHDPLDPASILDSEEFGQRAGDHVTVLADATPVTVAPGVEVLGAPWRSKRPLTDLANDAAHAQEPAAGATRVLVAHGGTIQFSESTHDPAIIDHQRLETAVAEQRVHYVALGDRHSTTRVGSTGRIWYAGAPEPTAYREDDAGNVLVVDCTPDACHVESVPVGRWRFVHEAFDLTGPDDVSAFTEWLDAQQPKERTVLRLALRGALPLDVLDQVTQALDHAEEIFASVRVDPDDHDLVPAPDLEQFGEELSGFARQAAQELIDAAQGTGSTEHDPAVAREALTLLYRMTHTQGERA